MEANTENINPNVKDADYLLWQRYKTTQDQMIKEELIIKYAPFVKYIAGRIAMNLPSNVEYDDLVGYGIFGLIDAIEKFQPNRQVKFKTYAQTRIRGSIFDELRVLDWAPRSVRQKARQLEKAFIELENRIGRPATDEEISEEMGIGLTELYKLYNETRGSVLMSLDEVCYEDESNTTRINFIEDEKTPTPHAKVEEDEMRGILAGAIGNLSERERLVVTLYYYEELTLKEIGEVLGVSDSRVSQLHTKAVLRLRGKLSKYQKDSSG
ncbi:RNA polymerase sigma factor WhiG [bacterium]|nr:RNA polymerase sigma factor WhiG [bacterium]